MKPQRTVRKILYPPLWALPPLTVLSALLLALTFAGDRTDGLIAWFSYFLSAYTLTAVVLSMPRIRRFTARHIRETGIFQKIAGRRFFSDVKFRNTVSIYQGLIVNTVYAVFRAITACLYRSAWFAAIAVYYILLGIARIVLARYVRLCKSSTDPAARLTLEYKGYRACGFWMLFLHVGMTVMTVLIIREDRYYQYPGYIIYLSAAYTFYLLITAAIRVFQTRKLQSPILSASKAIAFTGAMMSLFALQTALIAQFGKESGTFRQTANTLTGSAVCVSALAVAVFMIVSSSVKLYRLRAAERGKLTAFRERDPLLSSEKEFE